MIAVFSVTAIVMFGKMSGRNVQEKEGIQAFEYKEGETMYATIETSMGTIKARLDSAKAPITVKNFVGYVNDGTYAGTVFHRVIPGFMIQGGGFNSQGEQKPVGEPIKNEAMNGLLNKRGTLAMARTGVVDSATDQFFINLIDNDFLNYQSDSNYGYAVFGEVVEGMDIVDSIADVKTSSRGPFDDWPVQDVVMNKVTLSNN